MHFAAGSRMLDRRRVLAASGSDDELANATRGVQFAAIVHRRKALVGVLVAVEHDVDTRLVQHVPQIAQSFVALGARTVQRHMPVGQRAFGWMTLEILPEPANLG